MLEPEAEGLLAGDASVRGALQARARTLRARVARVDAVREELHLALFHRWAAGQARAPTMLDTLRGMIRRKLNGGATPRPEPGGYDPFVHLFGRSLPAAGRTGKEVAARIRTLLAADDATFTAGIAADLASVDPVARPLWEGAPVVEAPPELAGRIDSEADRVHASLAGESLRPALDGLARLSAWSWPVWRLDGEMLPPLLRTLGLTVQAGRADALFAERLDPETLEIKARTLPRGLGDFSGAGAFLSSTEVKSLAGSLRLYRARLAENLRASGEAEALLQRHLRLLEEAVLFCEAEDLALCEAAGVEWHDRGTEPG